MTRVALRHLASGGAAAYPGRDVGDVVARRGDVETRSRRMLGEQAKSFLEGLTGKTFVRGDDSFRTFTMAVRQRMHRYDYVEGPMIRRPRDYVAGRSNETFGHQLSIHTPEAAAGFDRFLAGPS